MKKISTNIFTYDINNGFNIDISQNAIGFSAWLYHKDYGIKMFLFGLPLENVKSLEAFEKIVENVITNEPYIETYRAEYM